MRETTSIRLDRVGNLDSHRLHQFLRRSGMWISHPRCWKHRMSIAKRYLVGMAYHSIRMVRIAPFKHGVFHTPLGQALLLFLFGRRLMDITPRCVIDQSKLEQSTEHKCQANTRPNIDGLGVADWGLRCIDSRYLRGHGQQCGHSQRYSRYRCIRV